ncbi:hypothetical protein [Camelimonas lactis]|uniref:Uncharacterized protein n=1 Tax=Camelimonas lactis TaxID=659006 RepID=A0A4R2GLU1_9HYPH|nr:hypothetical protein [Camelimonas lactis]TCO10031.1 hypothetical protein EV666_11666 [Camelimonas lactis]
MLQVKIATPGAIAFANTGGNFRHIQKHPAHKLSFPQMMAHAKLVAEKTCIAK